MKKLRHGAIRYSVQGSCYGTWGLVSLTSHGCSWQVLQDFSLSASRTLEAPGIVYTSIMRGKRQLIDRLSLILTTLYLMAFLFFFSRGFNWSKYWLQRLWTTIKIYLLNLQEKILCHSYSGLLAPFQSPGLQAEMFLGSRFAYTWKQTLSSRRTREKLVSQPLYQGCRAFGLGPQFGWRGSFSRGSLQKARCEVVNGVRVAEEVGRNLLDQSQLYTRGNTC